MLDLLFFTAWFIGHCSLVVLLVNLVHGVGWKGHWVERATVLALAAVGIVTVAGGFWLSTHAREEWPVVLRGYAAACIFLGMVGLPVTSLGLALRKPPGGIERRSLPVRMPERAPASLEESVASHRWIGDGPRAWLLRIPGNEALHPRIEDYRVEIAGLSPRLDGLRLVHLTDLHLAPCFDRRFFESIMDEASTLEPDLVLLTGDIVEHAEALAWIEPVLSRLRGRMGQYAILGNHDLQYGEQSVRAALAAAGFEDVDGRWACVEHGGGSSIAVGGTSAPWGPALSPLNLAAADLRIVLSHSPDLFYRIAKWQAVDLILSGHNHGGQVRLPLVGPVLMPSRFSRRFDRGFFVRGRTHMYVSKGLGAKHPLRWNCPPELTRLTLTRAGSSNHASRCVQSRLRSTEPDFHIV